MRVVTKTKIFTQVTGFTRAKVFTQADVDEVLPDESGVRHFPRGDYRLVKSFPKMCSFAKGCFFTEGSSFGEGCVVINPYWQSKCCPVCIVEEEE